VRVNEIERSSVPIAVVRVRATAHTATRTKRDDDDDDTQERNLRIRNAMSFVMDRGYLSTHSTRRAREQRRDARRGRRSVVERGKPLAQSIQTL